MDEKYKIYVVNHEQKEYIEIDTSSPLLCGEAATLLSLFNALMLKGWYYSIEEDRYDSKNPRSKVVVTSEVYPSYKLIKWSDMFECKEPGLGGDEATIISCGDYYIREKCDIDSPRD